MFSFYRSEQNKKVISSNHRTTEDERQSTSAATNLELVDRFLVATETPTPSPTAPTTFSLKQASTTHNNPFDRPIIPLSGGSMMRPCQRLDVHKLEMKSFIWNRRDRCA
jgi:hypothetical protein